MPQPVIAEAPSVAFAAKLLVLAVVRSDSEKPLSASISHGCLIAQVVENAVFDARDWSMRCIRRHNVFAVIAAILMLSAVCSAAPAQGVVVGVNLVNEPDKQTVPEQEATLGALQAAGVHVIRAGVRANDASVAFAQRAYAHGIKIVWIVGVTVDGPSWLPKPKGYTGIWSNTPGLSHGNPDKFRLYVAPLLDQLEAKGIVLAGFELGNEVN